ncbi:hypothetical protein SNEBB_006477 [Seison nebaliae]|nr:hypothetical protein SNEBB_006477 [Seison nebaliae]
MEENRKIIFIKCLETLYRLELFSLSVIVFSLFIQIELEQFFEKMSRNEKSICSEKMTDYYSERYTTLIKQRNTLEQQLSLQQSINNRLSEERFRSTKRLYLEAFNETLKNIKEILCTGTAEEKSNYLPARALNGPKLRAWNDVFSTTQTSSENDEKNEVVLKNKNKKESKLSNKENLSEILGNQLATIVERAIENKAPATERKIRSTEQLQPIYVDKLNSTTAVEELLKRAPISMETRNKFLYRTLSQENENENWTTPRSTK